MWGRGGERWERNREEEEEEEGAGRGEEMHAALLNSSFFLSPIHSSLPSSLLSFRCLLSGLILSCRITARSPFPKKCTNTEMFLFFVRALRFQRSAFAQVLVWQPTTAQRARVTKQKKPNLNTDRLLFGFESRHTYPDACQGEWGTKILLSEDKWKIIFVCFFRVQSISSLLLCFVSPLIDCAKVWLDHSPVPLLDAFQNEARHSNKAAVGWIYVFR